MNTYVADEHVTITLTIKRQTLRDLLCTVVEGGSNYWAEFSDAERTEDLNYLKVRVKEYEKHDDNKWRVNRFVTADELRIGIERLSQATFPSAWSHLAAALGDHDATTAYVVLQMTVFGDVIYG